MSSNKCIVGAYGDNTNQGSAYIFSIPEDNDVDDDSESVNLTAKPDGTYLQLTDPTSINDLVTQMKLIKYN